MFKVPALCETSLPWDPRSSAKLRSLQSRIRKRSLTLEVGSDRLSRNVGKELSLYAAWYGRRAQILSTPWRKPRVTNSTLMFLPGSFSTSCLAMSSQTFGSWPEYVICASFSQSLSAMWAYAPAGDACVTLVVVTTPVDLPASLNIKKDAWWF